MKLLSFWVILTYCINVNALMPAPYIVVYDDVINPALLNEHKKALIAFKKKSKAAGYRDAYYFYEFDNGHFIAFNPHQVSDVDTTSNNAWNAIAAQMPEIFLKENSKVYAKSIISQEIMKWKYIAKQSNENENQNHPSQSISLVNLQLNFEQRNEVLNALQEWKKQLKGKDLFYSVYSKKFGADLPQLSIIFHKNLEQPIYKLLPESVMKNVQKYDMTKGEYSIETSYGID